MVPDWSSIWSTLQSSGIIPEILSERFHNLRAKLSERLVPKAGLEPARPFGLEILSLLCLPFHHSGRAGTIMKDAPR